MHKLSTSHAREAQQRQRYLVRKMAEGKPMSDTNVAAMMELFDSMTQQRQQQESDPEWQTNNLEWDLRTTDWILDKARDSACYAQNIYAALCNNDFQKQEVWPMLAGQTWSCSWRYAGGIVADMLERGDYIDWYCSGIQETDSPNDGYVSEGVVTEEISHDFKRLGWQVVTQL
jgi:hypothetical protein